MKMITLLVLLFTTTMAFATLPTLYLTNQYGEVSNNYVTGGTLAGVNGVAISANTIVANLTSGSALPTAATYAQVAAKLPPSILLTGFVSGAGAVASTDTVVQGFDKVVGNQAALQNGTLTPQTEAIIAAGAVSVLKMESTVSNVTAGTYAVTLAAPSSIDGQIKIIKAVATMTHTVTLALTNVSMSGGYTPAGTTTLTFTNAGDSAVFIAIGAKWVYLGGSAVAS